jgi:type IV secretion system protein TrbI
VVSDPDQARLERAAEPVGAFRLRSEAPPGMRLSPKVLTGLVGVGAVVVFGALIWALYQGNRRPGSGSELYNTENKTTPDGLSTMPRDYSGLPQNPPQGAPQLGPPAPGRHRPAPTHAGWPRENP